MNTISKVEENKEFNPRFIDSLNHPLAKELRDLLSASQGTNQIIIDDEINILQAINGKVDLLKVYTTDKTKLSKNLLRQLPPSAGIIEVSKRTCKKIFANTRHSEVFATAKFPKLITLDALTHFNKDLVVLDDLHITGNIGAIIRTANAFDIDAMIFLNASLNHVYDRRIIRSSRGYIFRIPIVAVSSEEFIQFCKSNNVDIIITSSHANHSIEDITTRANRQAMVFGSEKEGCREDLAAQASYEVKIPINSKVESLNVSVAASIFLYLRNVFWKNHSQQNTKE